LNPALAGGEWLSSRPGRFTPHERASGTHWIGGCVDPRAGLHDVEKRKSLTLPGLELQPPCRPAGSQALFRQRYLGSTIIIIIQFNSIYLRANLTAQRPITKKARVEKKIHTNKILKQSNNNNNFINTSEK
jgi:hypothetical protein